MKKHLFLVILTLICNSIFAQDTTKTYNLNETVISYQAGKVTPITFQNISAKEIKLKMIGQEPSFLLSETPSITVYSDAGSSQGYSYFRMRGIDQTRINITFDGVPLNEPEDLGAYFSNYPNIFNFVSRTQIQRGVGTSKNGVASYAGSVQLFSPNPDTNKITFGLDYGSFNSHHFYGEVNGGWHKNKNVNVMVSDIHSDGYRYNSANNSQSVFINGGILYDKSTWKFNFLGGHQENQLAWMGISDSMISIDRRINRDSNEEDNFYQCMAQIQNLRQLSKSSTLQTSLYYIHLNGKYGFNLNAFLGLPTTDELYMYDLKSNLIGFFTNYTYSKKHFNWIVGFHGNTYNREHIGSEKTLGTLYKNNGYKDEASVFTKIEYNLKWLTIFGDIQYRYASFNYAGDVNLEELSWEFINPKIGLSATITPNAVVYYGIGSSGREPTRTDMFIGNDNLQADSLGNPILGNTKPEKVIDQELGIRYRGKRIYGNLNLYYMDFENEMVLDGKFGPNSLPLSNNVENSFRTGVELTLGIRIKRFDFINNSSFNYSRIKEQNITFSPILIPPIIINQEIIYSYKKITIGLIGRYQDKSYIDFGNTTTINGYFLLNGRIGYEIKRVYLSLFVNNITNTKYYNNGYIDFDGVPKYFVQAPVNFSIAVKYSF
jgi:iron complex outermembrane recepter protein